MIVLNSPVEILGKTVTHYKVVDELVDSAGQEILVTNLYEYVVDEDGNDVESLVYAGVAYIKGQQPYIWPVDYGIMTVSELDTIGADYEGYPKSALKADKIAWLTENA